MSRKGKSTLGYVLVQSISIRRNQFGRTYGNKLAIKELMGLFKHWIHIASSMLGFFAGRLDLQK